MLRKPELSAGLMGHLARMGVTVMPSNPRFRLVYGKFSLTDKKCNYGDIVPKFHLKITGRPKSQKTLAAWPFSLLLSV